MPDDPTRDSLAARLRADIRSQLDARLGGIRRVRDVVPAPAPPVSRVAASPQDITGALDMGEGLSLPVPNDLTIPPAMHAGLTATYRLTDVTGPRLSQANVNHVGQDLVTIDRRSFTLLSRERAVSAGCQAIQGDRVQAGDEWVNPAVLTALVDEAPAEHPDWTVERTSFEVAGAPVAAVKLSRTSSKGTVRKVYDAATGLRLEQVHAKADGSVWFEATYLGHRALRLPWAQHEPPDWVNRIRHLRFEGTSTISMGDTPISQRTMLLLDVAPLSPGVLLAKVTSETEFGAALPSRETWEMICASAMRYPLWIAPAALQSLTPNQLVDDDRATRFVMTFGGRDGTYATLVEQGPLEHTTYYFDVKNGMFAGMKGQRPYSALSGQLVSETWLREQR